MDPVCHTVCMFTPQAYDGTKLCYLATEANVCVNNLSKVALDSAAAGIEPTIYNRQHPNHTTPLNQSKSKSVQ